MIESIMIDKVGSYDGTPQFLEKLSKFNFFTVLMVQARPQ